MKNLLFLCFSCLALCLSAQVRIDPSIERLVTGEWKKLEYLGFSISFQADGVYSASYSDMSSSWHSSGLFSIDAKGINLLEEIPGRGMSIVCQSGSLLYDKNSPDYPYSLSFTIRDFDYRVPDSAAPRRGGELISIDGVKALCTGLQAALTLADLKCRRSPSLKGELIHTEAFDVKTGALTSLPYLPKGRTLTLLARTEEKERVLEWTNYWYYVEFVEEGPPMKTRAWVFGEFVALRDKKQ